MQSAYLEAFPSPTAGEATLLPWLELHSLDLRMMPGRQREALSILSRSEQNRAFAIRSPGRRGQFITTRALLRRRLAAALDLAPGEVVIRDGANGKPTVVPPSCVGAWDVSVSHSEHAALVALCRGARIGVDIERIAPERRWRPMLQRICAPRELEEAQREVTQIGELAFFARWVAKEAVLKALGYGLAASPAAVELRREAGQLVVEALHRELGCAAACRLFAIPVPTGFVGSMARVSIAPREQTT